MTPTLRGTGPRDTSRHASRQRPFRRPDRRRIPPVAPHTTGRDRPERRGGGGRSRMIPASFDYVRPADLDGALKILSEREGEAKLLAGGYNLLPLPKLRLPQPAVPPDPPG